MNAIDQGWIQLADRAEALGFWRAAEECREAAGVSIEWPSIVIQDVLDAETVTEE